jgi:hypothetical protein
MARADLNDHTTISQSSTVANPTSGSAFARGK